MPTFATLILLATTTTAALMAGLFFAYSYSVNPGLHRLSDLAYLQTMQSINRAIQNPPFLLCFLGTAVLFPASAWLHYRAPVRLRFVLLIIAAVIYGLGVLGVTIAGNIPLNDSLSTIDLNAAAPAELATHRAAFEPDWNRWHTIRMGASILALLLAISACLTPYASREALNLDDSPSNNL